MKRRSFLQGLGAFYLALQQQAAARELDIGDIPSGEDLVLPPSERYSVYKRIPGGKDFVLVPELVQVSLAIERPVLEVTCMGDVARQFVEPPHEMQVARLEVIGLWHDSLYPNWCETWGWSRPDDLREYIYITRDGGTWFRFHAFPTGVSKMPQSGEMAKYRADLRVEGELVTGHDSCGVKFRA